MKKKYNYPFVIHLHILESLSLYFVIRKNDSKNKTRELTSLINNGSIITILHGITLLDRLYCSDCTLQSARIEWKSGPIQQVYLFMQ